MKTIARFSSLCCFVALLNTGLGQNKNTSTSSIKKIASIEGITEYTLPNGLHVLLFPDASKPSITVNITYLVGSRHEGYGETGMAHLLEHMQFKGSKNHLAIDNEISRHGAQTNATTWYDRTNYFETFSASEQNLNWALSLEADRMTNSFIAEKDLKTEFSVVRNEFEMGENAPDNVLQERVLSTAYLWHNYGKSTIGSKEDIERVPIQSLQTFYKKYYQPDNAILLIAGKFDETKALRSIEKYFGNIPKPARILTPTYTTEPTQDGERHVELKRAGSIQYLGCAYHLPAGAHPDFPALALLDEILTNNPDGVLYKKLVATNLASKVSSTIASMHDPGFIYIEASVLAQNSAAAANTVLLNTLDSLPYNPLTQAQVEKARNAILKTIDEAFRNTETLGMALSEFIAQGDWRLGFVFRDRIKKASVEDVNRVAKLYFKPTNRTTGLFIPTPIIDRASIPATPNIDSIIKNYKSEITIAQGENFDATPANIEKRTHRMVLQGGAKLALLAKTTRGNNVQGSISLHIGSDETLNNKKTIAALTAAMLKKGTKNLSQSQLNDSLAKLQSSITISAAGQVVAIHVQSTKPKLQAVLTLLNEILHQPAFAADQFKLLQTEMLGRIESKKTDPQAIAINTYRRLLDSLPASHINYTPSFEEEINNLNKATIEEVMAFYSQYYNGEYATVAFVGDMDEKAVTNQLSAILSNWKASKIFQRIPARYHTTQKHQEEIKTPDKKNAILLAGTLLKLNDEDASYPALFAGNYVLGGGFLNSRLATRLRQQDGLSYGTGSFLDAPPIDEKTVFGIYALFNPDNKTKLYTGLQNVIDSLLLKGITANELKELKTGIVQQRLLDRSQDDGLAQKLNDYLYINRTFLFDQAEEAKLQALTIDQVNQAIKKYIDPSTFITVAAGDFK